MQCLHSRTVEAVLQTRPDTGLCDLGYFMFGYFYHGPILKEWPWSTDGHFLVLLVVVLRTSNESKDDIYDLLTSVWTCVFPTATR